MVTDSSNSAHYRQDLRRLTRWIGAALVLFGVALLIVVAYSGWSANNNAVARERQLVENALDQAVSQVLNEEKAIAWWDDAVINTIATDLDREWLDANFGYYFYETFGHDEIFILSQDNRPIYATVDGEYQEDPSAAYNVRKDAFDRIVHEARTGQNGGLRGRDGAFASSQERYSYLLGARDAQWAGHIFDIEGRPAVVTAMGIVPSVDAAILEGDPPLMVSIVWVDPEFMVDLGGSLLMPDLTITGERVSGDGVISEPFLADDGTPVGYLNWTSKRPGQGMLVGILPLVALSVFGVGLLAWDMVRRLKNASLALADREARASYEAKHDQLSGLPNRHNFVDHLQQNLDTLVQSRRGQRVVVAYLDVDRFKDVNDTLGHQAGDELIMSVAARLGKVLAEGDFLARFGGDEFAILRIAASERDVEDLIARLRHAFEDGFDVYGQKMRMTASIGLAMAPNHGGTPEELMRHADIALYQGKNQGRDRAMMFCAEMAAEVEQRREIELELRESLNGDALELFYQPIVSCATGKVSSVEALLRWRHPKKGDIPPSLFVPIAEEAGLMPALGAWVIERAFKERKAWPDVDVSINLSPVQFRHLDLVELMQRLLAEHHVDPKRIMLEVTEGVMLESTDRNRAILDAFRSMGFKVALDDFGTGYSSLRYLSDFRFDKIKIDRAFVTGIHERKRAMTIIQSVVTIGRGLGMDIVAEGVETELEASVMRLVGVNELQGYYFSRPVPPEHLQSVIDEIASNSQTASAAPAQRANRQS